MKRKAYLKAVKTYRNQNIELQMILLMKIMLSIIQVSWLVIKNDKYNFQN